MNISIILMAVGIVIILISFFIGRSNKNEDSIEMSAMLMKETSQLKRRLKIVEEELLLEGPQTTSPSKTTSLNGVHQILISQVLALHTQGYNIQQIAERSSLQPAQIEQIIASGGKR